MGFDSERLISRDSYRITGPEGIKFMIGHIFRNMPDFIEFSDDVGIGPEDDPGQSLAKLIDRPKDPPGSIGLIPNRILVNS